MKGLKSILAAVTVSAMLFGAAGVVSAEQSQKGISVYHANFKFVLSGKAIKPPVGQEAFLYQNSTYVPLRFIAYAYGKAVSWDSASYTVSLSNPNDTEQGEIQSYQEERELGAKLIPTPDDVNLLQDDIDVYFENVKYVFDGISKEPPEGLPGLIYKDTLYVPLRFMAESLGEEVGWDPATYTISMQGGASHPPADQGSPGGNAGGGASGSGAGGASGGSSSGSSGGTGGSGASTGTGSGGGASSGSGSSSGSSGSGSSTTTKSKDELVLAAVAQLYSLQSTVKDQFLSLKEQYLAASDADKPAIKAKAEALLEKTDSQVASILSGLKSKLTAAGYDTAVVDEIQAAYEKVKSEQISNLK